MGSLIEFARSACIEIEACSRGGLDTALRAYSTGGGGSVGVADRVRA